MSLDNSFKVSFWNVRGLANLDSLDHTLESPIVGLCETFHTSDTINLPSSWRGWNYISSQAIRDNAMGRAMGGLLLLFQPHIKVTLIEKNFMWIFVRAKCNVFDLVVGVVYFRPTQDISISLELLQPTLDDILSSHLDTPILILGDFNARLGTLSTIDETVVGDTVLYPLRMSHDLIIKPRGPKLDEFMSLNDFILLNGRTPGDIDGSFTFCRL